MSLGLEGDEPLPLLERRLERARLQRGAIPPEGLRPAGGGGGSPIGETEFRARRLGRAPAAFHHIFISVTPRGADAGGRFFTLGLLLVWCVGTYCFFSTHRCWRPGKARRDQYLERDVIVT